MLCNIHAPSTAIQRLRNPKQAPPPYLAPFKGTLTVSFAGKLHRGVHKTTATCHQTPTAVFGGKQEEDHTQAS